jgi:hypothetical protein
MKRGFLKWGVVIGVSCFGYQLQQLVVCRKVVNLKPMEINSTFPATGKIYGFAELTKVEGGHTFKFVWQKKEGDKWKSYSVTTFAPPPSPRWRSYSYITATPAKRGEWRLELLDGTQVIGWDRFQIK